MVIPKDNPYVKYLTKGCLELYALFFELAFKLLHQKGTLSFITGALYLKGLKFSSLRKFLETESDLISFRNEGDAVFKNVNMPTATILLRRRKGNSWSFDELIKKGDSILEKIGKGISLEKMSIIQRGLEVGRDKVSDKGGIPFITGTDVEKYCYKRTRQITQSVKKEFAKDERFYNGERVLLRETGAQLMAVYMDEHIYCNRSLYSVIIEDSRFSAKYVTACLNSKTLQYYYQICFKADSELFPKIRIAQAKLLPIALSNKEKQREITKLVDDIINIRKRNLTEDISIHQKKIDALIYNAYNLTPEEQTVIESSCSLSPSI